MHSRALARSSQYRWGGKACRARGIGYRPRYVWRGVSCARRWFVFPVIPRIGVQGHQACDFRGFRSLGSEWGNGKHERNFFFINRRTDCSCISGPVESTREFVVKFYSIAGGITMCESDCRRNWSVSSPWIGVQSSIISSCCSCRVGISVAPR